MSTITLSLTKEELLALHDALSEETVRMRKHVHVMEAAKREISSARKRLHILEGLLEWAKTKSGRTW